MSSIIAILNHWGEHALRFAWPMLWQSSLLIGLLYGIEWALRRKLRAGVRYALWLLVLAKLVLPPWLALPTAPSWWVRSVTPPPPAPHLASVVVTYREDSAPPLAKPLPFIAGTAAPLRLSAAALALAVSLAGSLGLLAWLVVRWLQVMRVARNAEDPPAWLSALLMETRRSAGVIRPVRLKLLDKAVSPAVCGLVRPTVLVPRALANHLSPAQIRTILWHELVHLRRGDVWVNCFQALLQLAYWWHPLLWLANARIRSVREQAVDDAVMLALREDAESYAPTLLEVARLALHRPLASLGLVGILESQRSLRQRIERLMDFCPLRQPGLTFVSVLCVLAFGAFAVPMGEGPAKATSAPVSSSSDDSPPPSSPSSGSNLGEPGIQKLDLKAGSKQPAPGPGDLAAAKIETSGVAPEHGLLPKPATSARTNVVSTSKGRRAIWAKLDRIRLDRVAFDGLPLGEVIRSLAEESRKRDPDGMGINFILAAKGLDAAPAIDPSTGLPSANPVGPANLSAIPITINPELHQARLADVLDAVAKGADKPIKFAIEDYAIVFSIKAANEPPALHARIIKVDPNVFVPNLRKALGLEPTNNLKPLSKTLRQFFAKHGVDLAPPKSVFFNDHGGALYIRATLQDLDIIEQAIEVLNQPPPQIQIKTRFIAVPEEAAMEFWQNLLGTVPSPTNRMTTLTATLTPPQARAVLRTLEANPKAALVNEAAVITLTGRQAQIQCVDLMTILTDINPQAFAPPGVSTNSVGTNGLYLADTVSFGPTLDLMPHVASDGSTIRLTLVAGLTEFLGYDHPSNSVPVYIHGKKQRATPPLPHFHVSSVTNAVAVRDGDTVMLGGICSETISTIKDKVPVLGDVPLVGKLFRSESHSTEKKQLLVFVTPSLIDPAGNRLHQEDESLAPNVK